MRRTSTLRELGRFIFQRKRYWLLPMVLVLVALGTILMLSEGSVVAPFIYTLF